jgi:hypothetical protein
VSEFHLSLKYLLIIAMRAFLLILFFFYPPFANSDMVKPALVEIRVLANSRVEVEIRTSIEAILTGINSQYKNTQDAPQAQDYEVLRRAEAPELSAEFDRFSKKFVGGIWLTANQSSVLLNVESVTIPEPGYTKVPRTSTIKLSGNLPKSTDSLEWYYPARFSDNAVRLRQIYSDAEQWHWGAWQWLRNDQSSKPILLKQFQNRPSSFATFIAYIAIGFKHIIPKGGDHLLFIIGLFLAARHWKVLLIQVSVFTVAHTLTLALAAFGLFNISPRIIEPLIALTIALIGLEAMRNRTIGKFRLLIIFAFGLLHGLGFAAAMRAFDLSADLFISALIGFNVGVELAQILALLTAWILVAQWIPKIQYRRILVIPTSTLICLMGLTWFFQRVL